MWAIRVESYGTYGCIVPSGNDGAQKLHNKTMRGWLSETTQLRKLPGTVYVMREFTQRMCEMSPRQLAYYVMCNGKPLSREG